jgi:UPF0271 protein
MATTGRVEAVDGSTIAIDARSLCVHGDTPGAVKLAGELRTSLTGAGVTITRFA